VAQEALVRAWRRWDTCSSEEARAAWLAAITRNEAMRWRRQRIPTPTDLEVVDREPVRSDPAEGLMQKMLVGTALAELSETEQQLVRLRYEDDLTQREIARQLCIPEGTVAVRLHRLRARLRDQLAQ
jgi:RNA polymerase sigma-70 factor (ECF subfamily)